MGQGRWIVETDGAGESEWNEVQVDWDGVAYGPLSYGS